MPLVKINEKHYMNTGLALSGGGARGIAHIGVLQALEEMKIPLCALSGTSSGAIVGAFYCHGYKPKEILEVFKTTRFYKLIWPAMKTSGLLNMRKAEKVFRNYFPENSFDALNVPLYVTATSLKTGKATVFHQGALTEALMASSAIPVLFHPVRINGEDYVDGGIVDNLPVNPLRDPCEFIIGSHSNAIDDEYTTGGFRSVMERSLLLAINGNVMVRKQACHVFLEPPAMKHFRVFDFSKADEIFDIGYHYTLEREKELHRAITG
jgi:NTE family protein